ncbi:MAG: hypothetical protein ABFS86_20710 [Planctomycetota bacterium]
MNRNVAVLLFVVGLVALVLGIWIVMQSGGEPADIPTDPPPAPDVVEGEDIPDVHPGHDPKDPAPPPAEEPPAPDAGPAPEPEAPPTPAVDDAGAVEKMKAQLDGVTCSLSVNDLEVSAALGMIAALAGVEIDTSQADADKLAQKVSFSFDEAEILDAVELVCTTKGLEYEIGPDGIIVR